MLVVESTRYDHRQTGETYFEVTVRLRVIASFQIKDGLLFWDEGQTRLHFPPGNDISPVPVSCCSMCASTGSVDGKSPCIRARQHQTSNTCTGTLYNLYFEVVPELTLNSHRSSFA